LSNKPVGKCAGRMSDYMPYYAFVMLVTYFIFLGGLVFATWNVERIAEHRFTEALVNKFRYDLRDLPRVNYKEVSSDEDVSDSFEEPETSNYDNSYNVTADVVKRRRERNPIGRIMDTD